MKNAKRFFRPVRVIASVVAAIPLIAISAAIWILIPPSFSDPWPVDESLTAYYRDTYEENREAFREACNTLKRRLPETTSGAMALPDSGEDLTIDVCTVPATPGAEDRLLILTSGLHGSEGFASSAVQRMVMREVLAPADVRPRSLFIHGINPYGMRHFRRVTANNVDLNRNFATDARLYRSSNPGYARVTGLLNPTGEADPFSLTQRLFPLRALGAIASTGMAPLRQAILQGQYEFPQGLYYGGSQPEAQRTLLDPLLRAEGRGKGLVTLIDLHTGFGERGTAHLFPNHPPNDAVRAWTVQLFSGYTVEWPDENSYSVQGEFCDSVANLLPADTRFVPMVIEYGTMNSQTTRGSIRSIQITILENQAWQSGCVTEEACRRIRSDFRAMYFPSSPSWRSKVLIDSRVLLGRVLERLVSM